MKSILAFALTIGFGQFSFAMFPGYYNCDRTALLSAQGPVGKSSENTPFKFKGNKLVKNYDDASVKNFNLDSDPMVIDFAGWDNIKTRLEIKKTTNGYIFKRSSDPNDVKAAVAKQKMPAKFPLYIGEEVEIRDGGNGCEFEQITKVEMIDGKKVTTVTHDKKFCNQLQETFRSVGRENAKQCVETLSVASSIFRDRRQELNGDSKRFQPTTFGDFSADQSMFGPFDSALNQMQSCYPQEWAEDAYSGSFDDMTTMIKIGLGGMSMAYQRASREYDRKVEAEGQKAPDKAGTGTLPTR